MAIDYNILVKIESVDKVRLHSIIRKIHNINPIEVDILNGVVVYNTVEETGFSYSLANTKDLLWGWDDVLLKEDFTYEQRIGFRLNKFNYDKAIKNLFSVFRYLFLEIKCDFLIKRDDNILLLRIDNTFFSPEENINWVKQRFDDSSFQINVLNNSN